MARMEIVYGKTRETFVGSTGTLIELLRGRLAGDGLLTIVADGNPEPADAQASDAGEAHSELHPLSLRQPFTLTFDPRG